MINIYPKSDIFVGEQDDGEGVFLILLDKQSDELLAVTSIFERGRPQFNSWLFENYTEGDDMQIVCRNTKGEIDHTYIGQMYERMK